MTTKEKVLEFCRRLNAGEHYEAAATAVDLDPDEMFGEDCGDESMPIDDPDNAEIDVAWEGQHTHYQLRRWFDDESPVNERRYVWEAFERTTLTKRGVPIG